MKAVILAAGVGKRLRPITNTTPKPLIRIGGKEILGYQLEYLKEYGINDFVIATGWFHKKVEKYVRDNYSDTNVSFVYNPIYEKTNYIYTLWLTKDYADDDIILLHGDLIFDKSILRGVIDAERNVVLISKSLEIKEKDFKALIVGNRVLKIGVNIYGKNIFSCMPMYMLQKKGFRLWLIEIEKFIRTGKVNFYAEDALNEIIDRIKLYPIYFGNKLCMEIDTMEDIKIAEKLISDKNE